MVRLKKKIAGPSPTGTKTHPRRIPHVLPTHVHHPPPTDQANRVVQPCSRTYCGIPVHEEHLVGSGVLRTRSMVRSAGRFIFTTPRHFVDRQGAANHQAHPPPTHRTTYHSSTTAVEQYVPTNLQRQHSSTAGAG